jgi:hypothetical protein
MTSPSFNSTDHRALAISSRILSFMVIAVLLATLVHAQAGSKVTGVDPPTGKVDDNVTVTGENLGKDSVSGVFLSDDTTDYKATVVDQAADKIVIKVPQVKPGSYNISIQVKDKILIAPVKIKIG